MEATPGASSENEGGSVEIADAPTEETPAYRPRIARIEWINGYIVHLHFTDGAERMVNLSGLMRRWRWRKTRAIFDQVYIADDTGTLTWPSGVDINPSVLYGEILHPDVMIVSVH